jgi:dynein heavy chain
MDALQEKERQLQLIQDELRLQEDKYNAAQKEKEDKEFEADQCRQKITRANQLLDGLGGERDRWEDSANQLERRYKKLTGDVLVSAGAINVFIPSIDFFE